MSAEEELDPDMALIARHVDQLQGHFDTVQVLCTRHRTVTHGGTKYWTNGSGNYLARYGQAKEWVLREEQKMKLGVDVDEGHL